MNWWQGDKTNLLGLNRTHIIFCFGPSLCQWPFLSKKNYTASCLWDTADNLNQRLNCLWAQHNAALFGDNDHQITSTVCCVPIWVCMYKKPLCCQRVSDGAFSTLVAPHILPPTHTEARAHTQPQHSFRLVYELPCWTEFARSLDNVPLLIEVALLFSFHSTIYSLDNLLDSTSIK